MLGKNSRELKIGNTFHIFNGGNLLPGSPDSWEDAIEWLKKVNGERYADNYSDLTVWDGPLWRFDCGFKLDFDGALIWVSSRFYPPANYYGPKWDGVLSVQIMGETLIEKEFIADTLDDLRKDVEVYFGKIVSRIKVLLKKEMFADL